MFVSVQITYLVRKLLSLISGGILKMDYKYEDDPQQYKTTGVAARVGDLMGLQQMVWNGKAQGEKYLEIRVIKYKAHLNMYVAPTNK